MGNSMEDSVSPRIYRLGIVQIAACAIATAFMFGLFGSPFGSGEVSAQSSFCTAGRIGDQCAAAIGGYDPVAYFSLDSSANATKGKKDISHTWQGSVWRFASKENLEKFKNDPEKYAPQYGGHCAYAASRNYLYSIDPHAWTVHNGKLYLNATKGVRGRWLPEINEAIAKADKNWPTLKNTR